MHVGRLVEWSNNVDLMGLPTEVWAVRELIRTVAGFHAFRGMPIVREFRVFTEDGSARCLHPYWLPAAMRHATGADWRERLAEMSEINATESHLLNYLAVKAACAVDAGSWSVDFLQGADGKWWLTDMAEAGRSWHWPGCESNERT